MKKLSLVLVTFLSATFHWVSGTDTAMVEIVQKDTSSFGGCRRSPASVVFEELLSGTGAIYKRAVIPAPEECLLGFVELDSEKHNLKTCLETAAKDGYNMFMLDGETCKFTYSKARQDVADSYNLVTVYAVEMLEPGDADTDTSLSFIVKDIKKEEFTVEYNDTGDCITGTRTYEVRVNGEVYDVQEQDDPQTINSGVDLPPCVEMEFVFTRYVDGVQVGQALSETSRTYQALPDDFLDLTFTASGTEVIVSWDNPGCWGLVQDYKVELKMKDATSFDVYEELGANATSFTVSNCTFLGKNNKFQVAPSLPVGVGPFTKGPFPLGEMALEALEFPLNLTNVEIIPRNGKMFTKATFTGDSCHEDVKFKLNSSGDPVSPPKFYQLNKAKETSKIPIPTSTNIYTLQRMIHGSQIGPTSDFTYTPPTTTSTTSTTTGRYSV